MIPNIWVKPCGESGHCVEIKFVSTGILVRDSKLGEGSPVLEFTREEWEVFAQSVKAGQLDLESNEAALI